MLPAGIASFSCFQINNKIYASLSSTFSMIGNSAVAANSIINALTVALRVETKWFSIFSPVSFRQHGDFAW